MRFKLTTSGYFYDKKDYRNKLKALGFEFEPSDHRCFRITDKDVFVDFETLQKLIDFSSEWGEIIVCGDQIEIYDNYRE